MSTCTPHILLLCQTLGPTLPTMLLSHELLSCLFKIVMLIAANAALISKLQTDMMRKSVLFASSQLFLYL